MLKSYNSLFNNEELQVEGHFVSDINKLIEQEKEVDETVNKWKNNLDEILVSPFNYNKWNE